MAQKVGTLVDKILDDCKKSGTAEVITASQLGEFIDQPYSVYCKKFVDPKYKDPVSNHDKLIINNGKEHEKRYVSNTYPGTKKLQYTDSIDGLEKCIKEMIKGTQVIWGAPLFYIPHGMGGRADILQREAGDSRFGKYHYVVKEVKSHKTIKKSDKIQCAFYNHILGIIQDSPQDTFYVVNSEGVEKDCEYDLFEDELFKTIDELREVLSGTRKVDPVYDSIKYGQWKTYCDEQAIKNNDVSIVEEVGPKRREKLFAKNLKTIKQLASCEKDKTKLTTVKGIGDPTADIIIYHAKALTRKKIQLKSSNKLNLPQVTTEIFLDLEGINSLAYGTSILDMDYLIGVLVRKNGEEKYIPFTAHDIHKEEEMLLEFLDFIKKQKDYVIYHWHDYERRRLTKMMDDYSIDDNTSQLVLSDNVRIDLHKEATSKYAFPTIGNSIKAIAPELDKKFKWRDNGVDAKESIPMYLDYVKNPKLNKKNIQLIQDYNEDDCKATLVVKDWLTNNEK